MSDSLELSLSDSPSTAPPSKKGAKRRPTPDQATQDLILLLHLVIEQLKRGGSGQRGGIDWAEIGNEFGADDPEKMLHPEAVRSRFRKSYDVHIRPRPGSDPAVDRVLPKPAKAKAKKAVKGAGAPAKKIAAVKEIDNDDDEVDIAEG
jgi:hypothetical protein